MKKHPLEMPIAARSNGKEQLGISRSALDARFRLTAKSE